MDLSKPLNEEPGYEAKLAMVATGMMDPKEIGLATAEEAQLKIMPEPDKVAMLGDFVTFEASEVPLELRAKWAQDATNIVLAKSDMMDQRDAWVKEHADSMLIQCRLRCGTLLGTFQQEYDRTRTAKALAFADLMVKCAQQLAEKAVQEARESNTTEVEVEVTKVSEPEAPQS